MVLVDREAGSSATAAAIALPIRPLGANEADADRLVVGAHARSWRGAECRATAARPYCTPPDTSS